MRRRVCLLVNPAAASGRASNTVERIRASLCSRGCDCHATCSTRGGQLTELAAAAATSCDVLLAAGGDGTVREVASGLLRTEGARAVLGLLPVGTGNDFGTQVGVASPEAAEAALLGNATRTVDVIEVRRSDGPRAVTDHALLFAAAGFAAELLRRTTPWVKRLFGKRLSYSVGFFRALLGYRAPMITVRSNGHEFVGTKFHVCAGNAEWAGGGAMRLSPGARLDDGRLELCVIEALGRIEALRCFPKLRRGAFTGHPKVRYFGGQRLSVVAHPPLPLALDGDVIGQTPATFRVLPGALRVLVPG